MIQPEAKPASSVSSVSDNTSFSAAPETGEQFNGYTLMVEAYAAIWLIIMAWFVLLWRKQASLTARLNGLESAIDRAEKKLAAKKAD